jgi:3-hydroxymyristoyl/3-hydroxydecanoyl-(acyl carrier protein) dehydratase
MSSALTISTQHPSIAGHFPGEPLVPGVVMLSVVFEELARRSPELEVRGIRKLKFLRRLEPGTAFTVEFEAPASSGLRFKCWHNGAVLAEGHLLLA